MSIKPGYYEQYDGLVFLVFGVSKHIDTNEELVIYYSWDEIYACPLTKFKEEVSPGVQRFKFLSSDYYEAERLLR